MNRSNGVANQAVAQVERTNITVRDLAEAAQKINEVIDLISDIASQAGKGFAVVASEVKSFCQSHKQGDRRYLRPDQCDTGSHSAAGELAQQAEMLRGEVERFLVGIQAA